MVIHELAHYFYYDLILVL